MVGAAHAGMLQIGGVWIVWWPGQYGESVPGLIYWTLFNGVGAVYLFFVLSGFVLARSLDREADSSLARAAVHFALGRILRLYPAVGATILTFTLIFYATGASLSGVPVGAFTLDGVVANLTLWKATIDGVTWSLQVEVLATPLIFVAALIAAARWGVALVAAGAALLVALSFSNVGTNGFNVFPAQYLNAAYLFVLGVLAQRIGGRLLAAVPYPAQLFALVSATAVFLLARRVIPVSADSLRWHMLCEGLAAVCIVSIVAFGRSDRLLDILDRPTLRFYGRISYSFYLLHPLSWMLLTQMSGPINEVLLRTQIPGWLAAILIFAAILILTTPIAWLSWRYVEVPARRLSYYLRAPLRSNVLDAALPDAPFTDSLQHESI